METSNKLDGPQGNSLDGFINWTSKVHGPVHGRSYKLDGSQNKTSR